jgi:omega-6 fatty acid desaturase (delta-12 desaturase)
LFIEEEGDIVFYKNKDGIAVREVEHSVLKEINASGWNPEEQDRVDVLDAKTD